jgi:predicted dehydrogenase
MYNDFHNIDFHSFDVAVICTESGNHFEHAKYFLENEKNVLIEKPITLKIEEAENLIQIAENKQLLLGVCHQNRFNSAVQKAFKVVSEGKLGKLSNITARILWNRNDNYYLQAPWRGTQEMDGGTLMNQCIHNIDLLQWFANSEFLRVSAERGVFQRSIEMEDFGAALVRFKNDTIGIIEGTALTYPKNIEETLSIFGEKGTIIIGGIAVNRIDYWSVRDNEIQVSDTTDVDSVYGVGHIALYKNYIDAINGLDVLLIDGKEGKKALEIILAIYENSVLQPGGIK